MQKVVQMQQVHGNNVVRVTVRDVGKTIPNCDALITNDTNVTLSARVADCLPISVIDKKGRGIGLIHAGWRGLENKIIGNSIRMMSHEFGIQNSEFVISIGPHICAKHYEIKEDVAEKFKKYPNALIQKDGKMYLDLAEVARSQFLGEGVNEKNIKIDEHCTFEDNKLYSFRRNKTVNRNNLLLSLQL